MFAALKSLVGTTDAAFPYAIGDPVDAVSETIWNIHEGRARSDGSKVTIFVVDVKLASTEQLEAARNAIKRLRTLRHPSILRFIASTEDATRICMATEPVTPLLAHLQREDNEMGKAWGMHQVAKALAFLSDAKIVHGNICGAAIMVDVQGDWKLGGVEFLGPVGEEGVALSPPARYAPPEGARRAGHDGSPWSRDMWGLGCLLWEVHNGALPRPEELKSMGKMSQKVIKQYVVLVSSNPKSRPKPMDFIAGCRRRGGFFDNSFVDSMLFLEEISVKDADAKAAYFKGLPDQLDKFPRSVCIAKILPQLLQAFQYGGAGYQVLIPMLKIGQLLEPEEYSVKIVPSLVKLFSSPDRATRISLLQKLELFAEFLSPDVVNNDIFPHVASGFSDTVDAMREQTVKSMLHLAPKLSPASFDNVLLKHFAKLQTDENAGIRANTTTCLGMIAQHLPPASRERVLIPAFLRATRDPFKHSRKAAMSALTATLKFYPADEVARKLAPSICPMMMDPEKEVRDPAFALLAAIMEHLQAVSDGTVPSTAAVDGDQAGTAAAASWGSWAGSAVSGMAKAGSALSTVSSKLLKKAPGETSPKSGQKPTDDRQAVDSKAATQEEEEEEWHDMEEPAPAKKRAGRGKLQLGRAAKDPSDEAGGWGDGSFDLGDHGDWGSSTSSPSRKSPSRKSSGGDGWGADEPWGDIEEPVSKTGRLAPVTAPQDTSGDGWGDGGDGDGWGDGGGDGWGGSPATSPAPRTREIPAAQNDGWGQDADGWASEEKAEPVEDAKAAREAARLQRKKEREARLEAKRSASGSGSSIGARKPMKLGLGKPKKAD